MFAQADVLPSLRLVLPWLGLIAGGVVALGCLAGALNGVLEGRTRPFGRGKADFWISFVFGLIAACIACFCAYRLFFGGPAPSQGRRPPAQQAAPSARPPRR